MKDDVKVVELTSALEDEYEAFVLSHPSGLLYYSLRFRGFLTEVLGCTARYAVALSGDRIAGVLPLMAAEGRYGLVLNSLPYYGSNGGILARQPEAATALATWYRRQVDDPAVGAATVIENPIEPASVSLPHHLVDTRVGHITWFDGSDAPPDDQLSRLIDGSARRNVRKAVQSGVEVTVENECLEELGALHRKSMAAAGGQAKDPSFFDAVPRHFRPGSDYAIYLARIGNEPVAALLVFFYGTTIEYYVPALDPAFRPAQPMAAVLHSAMTDAIARGSRAWNWGGSWTSHESLIRFKAKWGGQGVAYRYWTSVNHPAALSSTPEELLRQYPGFYVLPFSALAHSDVEGAT